MKKSILSTAIAASLLTMPTANAANWLNLQGTEANAAAGRAKVFGFIQTQFQKDYSDPFKHPTSGNLYIPPKLIGPNLDSQESFNVNRARIGVRGTGMPLDSSINYFLLAEFGNNGITAAGGGHSRITDASITWNTDAVNIRTGLFKTPGSEEMLQGIGTLDYIDFTQVSNQMLLERFPTSSDLNIAPPHTIPEANMSAYSRSVGAARDTGVQFFNSFKSSDWEHSYAVMMGNGNGLNFTDNDGEKDTYLYWSSEKNMGGKGPKAPGLKMFAWTQNGKRVNAYNTTQSQDRKRTGVGVKYLKKPYRVAFEYMTGEGMIFQGQHRPQDAFNDEKASGYYLDFGWYIPKTNWEVDLRKDSYTRGENHASSAASDESTFDTTTVGAQYHINKKTRMTMQYSVRDFKSDTAKVHAQLKGVGPRLALQLTHIF